MIMSRVCKLVCGNRSIDLNDGANYMLLEDWELPDAPSELEIPLTLIASAAQNVGRAQRLKRALDEMLAWGRAYDQNQQGSPLDLVVKLDDGLGDVEPLYGRGHIRLRVKDGSVRLPDLPRWIAEDLRPFYGATLHLATRPYYHGNLLEVARALGSVEEVAEKGIEIWEATTNLIHNPSFSYGAAYGQDWTASGGTLSQSTKMARSFGSCAKLITDGSDRNLTVALTLTAATYAISAYVYVDGRLPTTSDVVMFGQGAAIAGTTFTADADNPGWYRATATFVAAAIASTHGVQVKANRYAYIDDVQLELKSYCTKFCSGDMLHSVWAGTQRDSNSTRTAGVISLSNANIEPDHGAITLWFTAGVGAVEATAQLTLLDIRADASNRLVLFFNPAGNVFTFSVNGTAISSAAQTFVTGDTIFLSASWDFAGDAYALYVNSVASTSAAALTAPIFGTNRIYIGCDYVPSLPMDGTMYDLRIWGTALTAAQVAAVLAAGRGRGELPVCWTPTGDNVLYNHEDMSPVSGTGHCGSAWFLNTPGELPAGVRLWVTNLAGVSYSWNLMWVAFKELTRGLYSHKYKYVWEGETGADIGWDATPTKTVAADTSCSGGSRMRVYHNATGTFYNTVALVNLQGALTNLAGRWRLFARASAGNAAASGDWVLLLNGVTTINTSVIFTRSYESWTVPIDITDEWGFRDMGTIDLPPIVLPRESLAQGFELALGYNDLALDWQAVLASAVNTHELWFDAFELMPDEHSLKLVGGFSGVGDAGLLDTSDDIPIAAMMLTLDAYSIPYAPFVMQGDPLLLPTTSPVRLHLRRGDAAGGIDYIKNSITAGGPLYVGSNIAAYIQPRYRSLR